jgi:hypothetical protein
LADARDHPQAFYAERRLVAIAVQRGDAAGKVVLSMLEIDRRVHGD